MHCQRLRSTAIFLLSLFSLTLSARPALAHRLYARYSLLPAGKVRIECYYSTNEPAIEAVVRVYRAGDRLLFPASLTDEKGVLEFQAPAPEDLKIVIMQDGHRRELTISSRELEASGDRPETATPVSAGGDSRTPNQWGEVLAGLSFILALAAFAISLRNMAKLRAMAAVPRSSQALKVLTPDQALTKEAGARRVEKRPAEQPPTGQDPG